MNAYIKCSGEGLRAILEDGREFYSEDPIELADALFQAGVRHGEVTMPDWRQGEVAPHSGLKIAIHARLKTLARGLGPI